MSLERARTLHVVALCECGCGKPAPIAMRNDRRHGHVKGQAVRFIKGHAGVLSKSSKGKTWDESGTVGRAFYGVFAAEACFSPGHDE